jgi:hypothetical protein
MRNEQEIRADIINTDQMLAEIDGMAAFIGVDTYVARLRSIHPDVSKALDVALEEARIGGRLEALRAVENGVSLGVTPLLQQVELPDNSPTPNHTEELRKPIFWEET